MAVTGNCPAGTYSTGGAGYWRAAHTVAEGKLRVKKDSTTYSVHDDSM